MLETLNNNHSKFTATLDENLRYNTDLTYEMLLDVLGGEINEDSLTHHLCIIYVLADSYNELENKMVKYERLVKKSSDDKTGEEKDSLLAKIELKRYEGRTALYRLLIDAIMEMFDEFEADKDLIKQDEVFRFIVNLYKDCYDVDENTLTSDRSDELDLAFKKGSNDMAFNTIYNHINDCLMLNETSQGNFDSMDWVKLHYLRFATSAYLNKNKIEYILMSLHKFYIISDEEVLNALEDFNYGKDNVEKDGLLLSYLEEEEVITNNQMVNYAS